MNWSEMQEDWEEKKELVRSFWSRLTDDDLKTIDGSRDKLTGALLLRYGMTPEEAENNICRFEKEVRRPGATK